MTTDECQYCKTIEALRPYGPGRSMVCYPCATSTPERWAQAEREMQEIITEAMDDGQPIIISELGVIVGRPLRGLSDPEASQQECLTQFMSDHGLDPENPEDEDRLEDYRLGMLAFMQGSIPKPDEAHDTKDIRAGWQAGHDATLKACREESTMSKRHEDYFVGLMRKDHGMQFQEEESK